MGFGSRLVCNVLAATAGQTAHGTNGHVLIANDLTTGTLLGPRRQHISRDRHLIGLAVEKLDAARRATRVPAAGVQLVIPASFSRARTSRLPPRTASFPTPSTVSIGIDVAFALQSRMAIYSTLVAAGNQCQSERLTVPFDSVVHRPSPYWGDMHS